MLAAITVPEGKSQQIKPVCSPHKAHTGLQVVTSVEELKETVLDKPGAKTMFFREERQAGRLVQAH